MIELFKNHISLSIEEPLEGYQGTRFDWTGKILQVRWKGTPLCTSELHQESSDLQGHGCSNEFGISRAIGYDTCEPGELFPKIGVGMLQKESREPYDFFHQYPCQPFDFTTKVHPAGVSLFCVNTHPVYGFRLNKTITLCDDGFVIGYEFINDGKEVFITDEYVHNFLSIGARKLSTNCQLKIGKAIRERQFAKGLNPDGCVMRNGNLITWKSTPESDFFFEDVSEPAARGLNWELTDKRLGLSISESVDFTPQKINLWGRAHVVSPELFKGIMLKPGETDTWQRTFKIQELEA
ncbi:hypothetical protein [Carboxylicivirga taeanensis]|uniref:hypothetical protein n=1 Tax=Carboxylicivirga taeanensis TaxID=1416875 RepID=UPI003F6DAFB5